MSTTKQHIFFFQRKRVKEEKKVQIKKNVHVVFPHTIYIYIAIY